MGRTSTNIFWNTQKELHLCWSPMSLQTTKKLDHHYLSPYTIMVRVPSHMYCFELLKSMRIHDVFHVQLLEKYIENKIPGWTQVAPSRRWPRIRSRVHPQSSILLKMPPIPYQEAWLQCRTEQLGTQNRFRKSFRDCWSVQDNTPPIGSRDHSNSSEKLFQTLWKHF